MATQTECLVPAQPQWQDTPAGEKPSFQKYRLEMFEKIKARRDAERANMPNDPIKVTLPDGNVKEGIKNKTTPFDIAMEISKGLASNAVVAKVNGQTWDLHRPLEGDAQLELCKFDSPEGRETFWHSSAHVLGLALENRFGAHLCVGPAIEDGFYYDVYAGGNTISPNDKGDIEKYVDEVVKGKFPFERVEMSKDEALEMFKYNDFKTDVLKRKVPDGAMCTAYRCGDLIDLCRGPHVPDTGRVKAFAVMKNSSAYWQGQASNHTLQRVYGVSFPDSKELKQHLFRLEEAKKRDHRNVGPHQELFFFHELSPGSAFWLPHGARIYNKLVDFIRSEYFKRGYQEVITPNVYNLKLWEISGHAAHYKENMFIFNVEGQEFGMKPMNCPGHCLMFSMRQRSFRELPWRVADFGVLHRNELSGALSGLTRVRRFQQDDAHIFCKPEDVQGEIEDMLKFIDFVYGKFGLQYEMFLSTRPQKFIGEVAMWDEAEKQLAAALNNTGKAWKENPEDGAFYGPKIDINVFDALGRKHQCATIQLDFQLPIRFGLKYVASAGADGADKEERPIIVHRAILGSVERFTAILIEHLAGKWPFWLSPRQVAIVPVSQDHYAYAYEVQQVLMKEGYHVDVDDSSKTLQKKIRENQLAQYNYILVVGKEEIESKTVNVRTRDNVVHGTKSIPQLLSELRQNVVDFK
uniref:Probable threonine--tRNA ligase, cytoplasmic n=1 Tax=Hanusia phi TaxID=3032 RepID=A0A7S0E3V0_9CRYP